MKKYNSNIVKTLILSLFVIVSVAIVTPAFAATPSISILQNGNSTLQVSGTGDANSNVALYYSINNAIGVFVTNLGSTSASGYFNTAISIYSYSIPQGSTVYVVVNGQQSPSIAWPYSSYNNNYNNCTYPYNYNCNIYSNGPISLTQTSATLSVGQGVSIGIINGGVGTYAVSSNSNPGAVSAIISGGALRLNGTNPGSSVISVCGNNNNYGCINVYVTVTGYAYTNYNNGYYQNQNTQVYSGVTYGTPVAGVYLNQVPSTGVEWNFKTVLFAISLFIWSAFVAYIFIERRKAQERLSAVLNK